jgi:uncharacterized protein involved in outer membrane biogenesis
MLSRRARGLRFARTFAVVFVLLFALRLALPSLVRRYVSDVLAGAEGYTGTIGDLDLNLWRGAYELTDVALHREGGEFERPFIEVERADFSVQWASLLRGRVVAEIVLHQPRVEYVTEASGEEAQTGTDPDPETGEEASWSERIGALFPFRIDRFVVRDAEVRFTHRGIDPPVDLFFTETYLEVLNLTNQIDVSRNQGFMAEAELAGRPFGTGELEARLRFDPLARQPRFELDAVVRNVQMIALNDFLQAYGKVDAEAGTLEIATEFAASGGKVEGYVKTLIEDLQLVSLEEIDGPGDALEALWEGFVSLGAELLENQPRDRIAVRVPLRGELGAARTDLVQIVASLLRNAFVVALRPAIDESIELHDIEIARTDPEAER